MQQPPQIGFEPGDSMAHGGKKFRGHQNDQSFTLRWVDQASRNKIPLTREGALSNHVVIPRDQKVMSHIRVKASSLKGCLRLTPSDKIKGIEPAKEQSATPTGSKHRSSL